MVTGLKQEFFDNFKGYTKKDILNVINNLSAKKYEEVFHFFSVDSSYKTDSRAAKDVIRFIKAKLNKKYKIRLQEEFKDMTKNEIHEAVGMLNDNIRESLLKKYTLSSKKELIEDLTPKDISLIRDALNEIRKYGHLETKRKRAGYKNFFSLFEKNERKSVLLILKYIFTEEERKLIFKKYGEELNNTSHVEDLTNEENMEIHMHLIPKIKRNLEKLKNGYEFLSIEEIYSKIPEDLLHSRIKKLSNKEQEKIYKLFNKDLKGKYLVERSKIDKVFPQTINYKINGSPKKQKPSKKESPTPIKPFYDIFLKYKEKNETDEEFQARINSFISSKQLVFLSKKYGPDLKKCVNDGDYTKEEDKYIIKVVIPTIKRRIEKSLSGEMLERKTLLEKQPIFVTEEDFDIALSGCTIYEQNLIKRKEEMNKNKKTRYKEFTPTEGYTLKLTYAKIRRLILERKKSITGIQIQDLRQIKEFLKTDEYKKLTENHTELEALSIMIKIHKGYIPVQKISILTGVDTKIIIDESVKYLISIQKEILNEEAKRNLTI